MARCQRQSARNRSTKLHTSQTKPAREISRSTCDNHFFLNGFSVFLEHAHISKSYGGYLLNPSTCLFGSYSLPHTNMKLQQRALALGNKTVWFWYFCSCQVFPWTSLCLCWQTTIFWTRQKVLNMWKCNTAVEVNKTTSSPNLFNIWRTGCQLIPSSCHTQTRRTVPTSVKNCAHPTSKYVYGCLYLTLSTFLPHLSPSHFLYLFTVSVPMNRCFYYPPLSLNVPRSNKIHYSMENHRFSFFTIVRHHEMSMEPI